MKMVKIAIVGATGIVGQTFIKILQEENNENIEIELFASNKSVEKEIIYNNKLLKVSQLNENSFDDVDYAMFFTSDDVSKIFIPIALKKNVVVIDNSSAFRMDKNPKLVIADANDNIININEDKLISNPNCCSIQCLKVISKIKEYSIKRIIYNTYQSVSGSGKQGIDDLIRCRKGLVPLFYETDISFTCIPKIGEYQSDGFTSEEEKLVNETKRFLNDENIDVLSTCVRVPVMFSHGVSVQIDFNEDFDLNIIKNKIFQDKDIVECEKILPTSVLSCRNDKIYVGRIRKHKNTLLFYCVADNIRVGAATNSYKILKKFIKGKDNEN